MKDITGTDAAKYHDAVYELDNMLMLYNEHGDGRFLLKAYLAMRRAERFYPSYKSMAEELGIRFNLAPECTFVAEVKPRVLAALDTIVGELLSVSETSTADGKAKLIAALQWSGRGLAGTDARVQEQAVTRQLFALFTMLDRLSDREVEAKDLDHVTSFNAAFSYVANSLGVGKSNVRKIWEKAIEAEPARKEDADRALRRRRDSARKRNAPRQTSGEPRLLTTKKPKTWR